jgi:hypothetical protein
MREENENIQHTYRGREGRKGGREGGREEIYENKMSRPAPLPASVARGREGGRARRVWDLLWHMG